MGTVALFRRSLVQFMSRQAWDGDRGSAPKPGNE